MTPTPDELILALLRARPRHGYQLMEAFNDPERLAHVWHMSTAQIYAVLKRLEREGAIRGVSLDSPHAPARVEFHVTPEGEARLMAWLDEATPSGSIRRVRVDFQSRIYAATVLGLPLEPLVRRQYAACAAQRDRLAEACAATTGDSARLALSFQLAQTEAVLGWMRQAFERITTR